MRARLTAAPVLSDRDGAEAKLSDLAAACRMPARSRRDAGRRTVREGFARLLQ